MASFGTKEQWTLRITSQVFHTAVRWLSGIQGFIHAVYARVQQRFGMRETDAFSEPERNQVFESPQWVLVKE